ncbi:MAG TPA: aminoglycoside phosphotransferase family protein [Candidatus Stackebrandtia excrementipullorum]|nr:aminoglycoside phosphotransferase family protein [Candidatus Stackebrandtia excrementipullorum]
MSLVPPNVDSVVRAGFGERGRRWLADLPEVVAKCCRDWELEIIGPAMEGGTHSYAAPVMWSGTQPAVLKIPVTDEENRAEAGALYCYDGEGAVRLYAYDPESAGMLLEWARPGRPLVPVDPRVHREGLDEHFDDVAVACELYRRLWRVPGPLPDGFAGFESAVDVVAGWRDTLPKTVAEHSDAFEADMVDLVEEQCRRLATPDGPVGLVNRDTHLGNIVAAEREPWLLIDPKPLLGERAFDAGFLAIVQVESRTELEFAQRVVHRTARLLGVTPERVRAWTLLRAVEVVHWLPQHPFGRRCLAIANLMSRMGDQVGAVA